ncbi:aminopeptidase P family protein [Rhizomicrobium electricum]|uniref:Aminopeptidase P family protein n=1 Tax=Rhizomicrobium electricum TaxID=480070 RepID=A0ABN1EG66_9PROT|nr:aminopeptidase P family protein [Rhizomicrobium electricum]NIJ48525.1 Xaa-Pro aminopeptidase [Rhizomicrobium electricum]
MKKIFQSFDEISDPATCAPHLKLLREELARRGLDGFLVPRSDEHQGEYVPKHAERLAWLTAFTGSAGIAVVLKDKAAIFVDGRYTLMVRGQVDLDLIEPHDLIAEGPGAWLEQNAPKSAKIGFDPWLHTASAIESLTASVEKAGATLVACSTNPIDAVWADQPEPPTAKAIVQPFNMAGETSEKKRTRIAEEIKAKGTDALVQTMPDSIAWLFNIRGDDVPHTPFALSFAILHSDGTADWFIDEKKTSPELIAHLGNSVRRHTPAEFAPVLDTLKGKTVAADPNTAAAAIFARLEKAGATVKRMADPCQLAKACKNSVEIEGMRKAHLRDGIAMAKFLCWLDAEAPKGGLDEIKAAQQLEAFRSTSEYLTDLSFDSISAASEHAAIPHYHVTQSSNLPIKMNEIYLIDSGGQYPDGTTDITRTIIVGTPSAEMKDRFTRVLKGHIALATAKFPEGTAGVQLDSFARRPLWDAGLDYDHGTGHGVGAYLSVHEGPQNISKRPIPQALKPGMVISNEPGYYKAGEYGIRIENLVVVQLCANPGDRRMMEFETITLAPIDTRLIEPALMTEAEKAWLNAYHARVREVLSPLVDDDTKAWLAAATRAI